MDDFIEQMADIIELDADEISSEHPFREYEAWDSLAVLSTLALIEEDYDVAVSNDELRGVSTLQQLWDLVQAKRD